MKKFLALILSAALLLTLTGLPASATPTVFFAAVGYELLPLDEAHMPITSGGKVYAPTAVFTPDTGIFFSRSESGRLLMLYGAGFKELYFDLEAAVSYDKVQYNHKAIWQNGLIYLPAEFVCNYFGLPAPIVLDTEYGPLLRLRLKSSEASDQNFLSAANDTLSKLYTAYAGTPPPANPSGAPPPSAAPSPSPSPTPPPRPIAYLTFDDGPTAAYSDAILDILDQYHVKATFFLLGENMKKNEPAVRRMIGSGHAVGLHSYTHRKELVYASPMALVDELRRANDKLEQLTMYRSRLVRIPYGSGGNTYFTEEMCQAMTDAGYRFWDWNVDGDNSKRKTADQIAAGVIDDLEKHEFDGPAIILLHEREQTTDALPAILEYMTSQNYIFTVCTESERPFNRRAWIK